MLRSLHVVVQRADRRGRLAYMAVMFAIAFYGDRRSTPLPPKLRAWVYSLSLAVYCTSWTFFGAVGQAAEQLWAFLPIYLGPVLLLIFAPGCCKRWC